MSCKFTTFRIKPTDDIDKHSDYLGEVSIVMGQKEASVKSIGDGLTRGMLLGIPSTERGYMKIGVECTVNLLQGFAENLDKNVSTETYFEKPNKQISKMDIPMEFQHQFMELSNLMQYMVNCTSWKGKEYYSFDAIEIRNKLKNLLGMSEWILNMINKEEK